VAAVELVESRLGSSARYDTVQRWPIGLAP
jgi:hypothetical protein